MAAALLARAGPSTRLPLLPEAVGFIQARHAATDADSGSNQGVAAWKLNRKKKEYKTYKREHKNGIFHKMPDSVLSLLNFQAPAQTNFPEFQPTIIEKQWVGQPTAFASPETGPMRWFGTPKPTLIENRLLSRPCTVVRDTTLEMVQLVERAKDKSSSETRICYTGRAGTGKSHLLLQTVHHCHAENWIVIYVPRAQSTVNSTTTHVYDLRTQTYLQPFYSFQLVQRILSANADALSTLKTTKVYEFDKASIPEGSSLQDLLAAAASDKSSSPFVLEALIAELSKQETYPVLMAVDDFQALYTKTSYKDPHFQGISSYHLSVPRLLMEFASGQKTFTRGAFFSALSASNTQFPISNDVYLGLGLDQENAWSPYFKQRKTLQDYLSGIVPLQVPDGMTKTEAAGLFDIWANTNGLGAEANDSLFMSKYTESAGNPRHFVWDGLLRSFDTPALVLDTSKPYAQLNVA